jgi:succinyl-diaminopimelate desuccinylase
VPPNVDEIITLAQALIGVPSRAQTDDPALIVSAISGWCTANGLHAETLSAETGVDVGAVVTVEGDTDGPSLWLNACVDTAPFGEESKWKYPPTAGVVKDGRLFGRGAADSKTGAAIFLLLMREFKLHPSWCKGRISLLLDADEHTGEFHGVKEFVRRVTRLPNAAWLGYPGNQTIIAGSRGFLRAKINVGGQSAHTGSKRRKGINAVERASQLAVDLERMALPTESIPEFRFGPSLNVTAIHGGEGYSIIPDQCVLNIDIRLTPSISAKQMQQLVQNEIDRFDTRSRAPSTKIVWEDTWPAFRTPDDNPAIASVRVSAEAIFGREIRSSVSGPSNIGNYLASLGIPAMAGFGVTYDNVHATDEWCEIESIMPVYRIYQQAAVTFLSESRL